MSNVLLLGAAAVLALLVWRDKDPYVGPQSQTQVPEGVIQELANTIRAKHPDIFPIETIFINQLPDGTVSARMLFINLRGFFGIQYDVVGKLNNGKVEIISMTEQVQPDRNGPFQAFKPDVYAKFQDVRAAVLETLKSIK
jgi:hypothetical protein